MPGGKKSIRQCANTRSLPVFGEAGLASPSLLSMAERRPEYDKQAPK